MKRILALTAFVFGIGSLGMAQTAPSAESATMTKHEGEKYTVSIDTDQPLQEYYLIDISTFGWTSEADAKKRCGYISNNLITYSVEDYSAGLIRLTIHADRTYEPKDVNWWNDYLQTPVK